MKNTIIKFGTLFLASAGLFLATNVASAVNDVAMNVYTKQPILSNIASDSNQAEIIWEENNTIGFLSFNSNGSLTIDKNLFVNKGFYFNGDNEITVLKDIELKINTFPTSDSSHTTTFKGDGTLTLNKANLLNFRVLKNIDGVYTEVPGSNPIYYAFDMTNGFDVNGNITVRHNNFITLGKIWNTTSSNIVMSGDSSLSFTTMNEESKKATIGDITLSDNAILEGSTISNTSSTDITLKDAAKLQSTTISGDVATITMGSAETASTGSIENVTFGGKVGTITMYGGSILGSTFSSDVTSITMNGSSTIGKVEASETNSSFGKVNSITLNDAASIKNATISGAVSSITMGSVETASTGSIEKVTFGGTVGAITMFGGSILDSTFSGDVTSITMSGGSITSSSFGKVSNITLSGSASFEGTTKSGGSPYYYYANVNVSGDSTLKITPETGTGLQNYYRTNLTVADNASVIINAGTVEFGNSENGVYSVNSTKTTYLGSWLVFTKGKTSISSQVVTGKVDLKSELTLNVENALKAGSLNSGGEIVISENPNIQMTISANSNAKLILNANQQFGSFIVNKTDFIVDLKGSSANSNTLSFDTLTFGSGSSLVIYDFVENMVQSSSDFSDKLVNMKVFSDDGTTEIAKELLAVKEISTGVWGLQFASSVPEPAEWAMIFGAIAFGFVAYRRRK